MQGRAGLLGLAAAAATLAACGPIPRADAERFCADRFGGAAPWVSGTVRAGLSDGKPAQDYELNVAPGIDLGGTDPNAGYAACVQRKSGAYPSRQLYEMGG
ncbi:hypothetical protein [Frigidibacter sp. MR17.24]|uniref:hypothetical protein n=1 Tax=Frigidibacter sp. MR17.24 TaxID=3127345 RepID=UPI0030131236